MTTFTKLEVEYLIAAVQSKFQTQRDCIDAMILENDYWVHESLDAVQGEVERVIRKWAEPKPVAVEDVRKMYPVKGES